MDAGFEPELPRKKWSVVGLVILLGYFLGITVVILLIGEEATVPKYALTQTDMYIIQDRVFDYIRDHGVLPDSLEQLSESD